MNLTIRIPGKINPDLNPNSHRHWRVKHRAQQRAKADAYFATRADGPQCRLDAAFAYDVTIGLAKGEKRKDDDNAAAMTKHHRDGIAMAFGCQDDKRWRLGTVEQVRDPEGVGYIEFRLTEITGEQEAA
jgi:hypothetical protein